MLILPNQSPVQEGTFKRFDIGKNIWKYLYNSGAVKYIAMTGSDVIKQIKVPFPHRFLRVHLFHTTSANVASTDALAVTLRRKPYPSPLEEYLYREYDISASRTIEVFGEAFEYEGGTWDLILNSTSTDRIYPLIYLQELKG